MMMINILNCKVPKRGRRIMIRRRRRFMYINAEHQVTSTHSQSRNILNYYANERKKKQKRKKALQELFANSLSQLFWLLSIALRRKIHGEKTTQDFHAKRRFSFFERTQKATRGILKWWACAWQMFPLDQRTPQIRFFWPFWLPRWGVKSTARVRELFTALSLNFTSIFTCFPSLRSRSTMSKRLVFRLLSHDARK